MQLKEVKEKYWQGPYIHPNHSSDLMILYYRRKLSKRDKLQICIDEQNKKKAAITKSSAVAVPKHLSFCCAHCNKRLNHNSVASLFT